MVNQAQHLNGGVMPLLSTKIQAPTLLEPIVPRAELVARLQTSASLRVIAAPPGYGKTTLAALWMRDLVQAAWLTLDELDNDPARFLAYFNRAISQIIEGELELGAPDHAIADALNQLALRPGAGLVMDDYHVIHNDTVHNMVAYVMDHLPANVTLTIISRAQPPLPLARYRLRGELLELTARDLHFTREEAAQLLPNLPAALVDRCYAQTVGWCGGLRLAALLAEQGDVEAFNGAHRYVGDYFTEEVFARQPEDVQEFLLGTSIFNEWSGALCDAVLGRDDSHALLERLEASGVFVLPLDTTRRAYTCLPIFRAFLYDRLCKYHAALLPDLHARAAAWFEREKRYESVVHHLLAAKLYERAAFWIEQQVERLMSRGALALLMGWIDALPDEIVCERATLRALASKHGGRCDTLIEPLSEREVEVLHLISNGMSNPEIAKRLIIAVSTVKTHVKNIYRKLDVDTRYEAMQRARELNLLHIELERQVNYRRMIQ